MHNESRHRESVTPSSIITFALEGSQKEKSKRGGGAENVFKK